MPTIKIEITYPVNLEHYPDCTTDTDAAWADVRSLQEGHISLAEFTELATSISYDVSREG